MDTVQVSVSLQLLFCANCAMPIYLTNEFMEFRKGDGREFHCPAGHKNVFTNSDNNPDKLKAKVNELQTDNLNLHHTIEVLETKLAEKETPK